MQKGPRATYHHPLIYGNMKELIDLTESAVECIRSVPRNILWGGGPTFLFYLIMGNLKYIILRM
jgi:hypothetical protein